MRHAAFGLLLLSTPAAAEEVIADARYTEPTTRYDHGILGDAIEWGALNLTLQDGRRITLRLPESRVFEDIAPRLADLDSDGAPEVIVIETDLSRGASLAVYDARGKRVSTPYIGRTHRWLAPLGVADLDGDGTMELAYIDRPHLAKTLRIWRYENGRMTWVADRPGLTNHRIGESFISGGIRDCGTGPEIVTADADWSRVIVSGLRDGTIVSRDIGPFEGQASFVDALACK